MFDTATIAVPTRLAAPPTREEVLADLRRRMSGVLIPSDERTGAALRTDLSFPDSSRVDIRVVDRFVAERRLSPPPQPQVIAVPPPLAEILPFGGLAKGSVVRLCGAEGSTSLLFAVLAASGAAWSAVVGMPDLGLLAAAEHGVDLDRIVVVPNPGPDILQVLSVLVDGVDIVVVAPPAKMRIPPARLRVLTGRLRQSGALLLVTGSWPTADLVLDSRITGWSGIGRGHGRLRDRELTVEVRGRGAAGRRRTAVLQLRSDRSRVLVGAAAVRPVDVPLIAKVG